MHFSSVNFVQLCATYDGRVGDTVILETEARVGNAVRCNGI